MSDSSRVIWVIRHAEREDNINPKNWMVKATNPHGLKYDNSPLSSRGRKQAKELAERFSKVPIDQVFASPYERTVETATILLKNRNIPIKPEPGLLETHHSVNPSFEDFASLKKRFPLIDDGYRPVYNKPKPTEDDCARLRKTLDEILSRYKDAKSILLVSHSSPIGAIHEVLVNDGNRVGQATVSKFVETAANSGKFQLEFTNDASHLSDKKNLRA